MSSFYEQKRRENEAGLPAWLRPQTREQMLADVRSRLDSWNELKRDEFEAKMEQLDLDKRPPPLFGGRWDSLQRFQSFMEKPTSDLSEAERTLRAQFALMRPFCALAFGTFFTFGWHLVVKSMNRYVPHPGTPLEGMKKFRDVLKDEPQVGKIGASNRKLIRRIDMLEKTERPRATRVQKIGYPVTFLSTAFVGVLFAGWLVHRRLDEMAAEKIAFSEMRAEEGRLAQELARKRAEEAKRNEDLMKPQRRR